MPSAASRAQASQSRSGISSSTRLEAVSGLPATAYRSLRPIGIPQSVLTALAGLGLPQTVGGVLELGNRALGAQPTGGATLSSVNAAVDAINKLFDECRWLIGCN